MTNYAWPSGLKPRDFGFWPENMDRSGGPSMAGGEQVVSSPGGRWRAAGMFSVRNDDQVLALRALALKLKGRANNILVPAFDGRRVSWPVDADTGVVLHPGNTRHKRLDGTQFEDPEIPAASEIIATVSAVAGVRATTLSITKTQGGAFREGQFFGLGSRLYGIETILDVAGSVTTCTIWPPLRVSASAGDSVLVTRPACIMRLADPTGLLKELQLLRFADLQVEFVEVF